ncbi:MAG: hypothetical protein EOM20_07795 [Spartobacteria bacterium]|nr:hypothetical protein [Spartobacteria bacterium]
MSATSYIKDRDIYQQVIQEATPLAEKFLWIATSDLKDMYVDKGQRKVPFIEILSDLIEKGVPVRLLHAKEPGPIFRAEFDRYPNLIQGLERMLCPRVHLKCVIIDGIQAYCGSANLTGAGMGAKHQQKRNFEAGIFTTDPGLIEPIMEQFDNIWMGVHCDACQRKEHCPDYGTDP